MIPRQNLDAVRTIVTHDSCADGTASAIILRDAYAGKGVGIRFIQYGSDAHRSLQPEPGMLFCDITPVAEMAREFVQAGAIVLDHHRTARGIVEQFGESGVFADENAEPGVCGAVLAYREVWRVLEPSFNVFDPQTDQDVSRAKFIHEFATLAGIRDTWQRQSPRWEDACAQSSVLSFVPNERWLQKSLSEIADSWKQDYEWLGLMLQDKHARDVARTAAKGWPFTTEKGVRVLIIPSTQTSDVAELLDDKYDLVVGFGYTFDPLIGYPQMILSTRSHTTFDCSTFCRSHGGGGHTKAAGCSFKVGPDMLNPYEFIEGLIRAY